MNGMDGIGEGADRISLWKLDRLIQGDLPREEADALRAAVSKSPESQAYLERGASLKSGLTLEAIGSGSRSRSRSRSHSVSRRDRTEDTASGWTRIQDLFSTRSGVRGPGFAFAFVLALGLGVWTWRAQEAPMRVSDAAPTVSAPLENHHVKGSGDAVFRIVIRGVESDTGLLISARNGDTLALAYRSPRPVRAQIWYREEGGDVLPMAGPGEALALDAAMAWRPMSRRIVLEGEWKRQTVWVIWSPDPFTAEAAKVAVDDAMKGAVDANAGAAAQGAGGASKSPLRVEAFRMVRQL